MMFVSLNNNTTGVTRGAETAIPSGAPEFTPGFSGVLIARCLGLCVVFCRSLSLSIISETYHDFV